MTQDQIDETFEYIKGEMAKYHKGRIEKIASLKPQTVLQRKNPYIFLSKNLRKASDLAEMILQAHSSSSEETQFGNLLEDLAVYVSAMLDNGVKSTTAGIDLDFTRDGTRYLVAIKSGQNWGNSDQQVKLKANFNTAKKVAGQSQHAGKLQAILGCCYGKFPNSDNGAFIKTGGQKFWNFITGTPSFYTDIIEPISHEAELNDEAFSEERDKALNRFEKYILVNFCDDDGVIDWERLVQFSSGNL